MIIDCLAMITLGMLVLEFLVKRLMALYLYLKEGLHEPTKH